MILALMLLQASNHLDRDHSDLSYDYPARQSDQAFAAYSECLLRDRSSRAAAKRFIRMPPESPGSLQAAADLATEDCLRDVRGTVTMRFRPNVLRPAIFAALYKLEFGRQPAPIPAEMPDLKISDYFDGPLDQVFAGTRGRLAFGTCVVRADATATRAFVLARPWTPQEETPLPSVVAASRGCLTDAQTLRFGRTELRGILAEALYDMSLTTVSMSRGALPSK